jgi:AcrR family transcriptional regulator
MSYGGGVTARTSTTPAARAVVTAGLRDRKKDATRRALVDAAVHLAAERGYDGFTIADVTDAAGVSRRTFSNYFTGKAECLAALTERYSDEVFEAFRTAPADRPLPELLRDALQQVATAIARSSGEAYLAMQQSHPELEAADRLASERLAEEMFGLLAPRIGLDRSHVLVQLLVTFSLEAARLCIHRWVSGGRAGGRDGLAASLDLAFSLLDLSALRQAAPAPRP